MRESAAFGCCNGRLGGASGDDWRTDTADVDPTALDGQIVNAVQKDHHPVTRKPQKKETQRREYSARVFLGRRTKPAHRKIEEDLLRLGSLKPQEEAMSPRIRVTLKAGIHFRERPQVPIDSQHGVDAQEIRTRPRSAA